MTTTTFLLIVLGVFITIAIIVVLMSHRVHEIYVQESEGWRVIDSFLSNTYYPNVCPVFQKRIAQYEEKFPCGAPHSFICVRRGLVTLIHESTFAFRLFTQNQGYASTVCL